MNDTVPGRVGLVLPRSYPSLQMRGWQERLRNTNLFWWISSQWQSVRTTLSTTPTTTPITNSTAAAAASIPRFTNSVPPDQVVLYVWLWCGTNCTHKVNPSKTKMR